MQHPKWNDPGLKAGTMVRTALWLVTEIGIGNVFTKDQHRQAFAGVTQADRRLRDLRNFGWVIHTNLEDLTLKPNEQRLVTVGSPLWETGVGRTSSTRALTAKQRRAIFAEHDYQCIICGIGGGERYPDSPQIAAVLSVVRRVDSHPDGREEETFSLQCKLCRAGGPVSSESGKHLLEQIRALSPADKAAFIRWSDSGRRSSLDRAWAEFRRLPSAARQEIRRLLGQEKAES